jgi:hypothetical protein
LPHLDAMLRGLIADEQRRFPTEASDAPRGLGGCLMTQRWAGGEGGC